MIDFQKDYTVENDKILLRPLQNADFESLMEFSVNEPDIWKYNAFGAGGEENLRKYIDTALSNRDQSTEYPFTVIDKSENKIVGSTRFYAISNVNKTLELGYTWYGKKYQGTYVNKNSKLLFYMIIPFLFQNA